MKENRAKIEPSPILYKAIRRVLSSLVHFFLNVGITFPQVSELLKEVYIEVADRDFRLKEGQQSTQTRLSFLTGVHRKDVKRLSQQSESESEPENVSVGVQLISLWLREDRYLDSAGKALNLPLRASSGPSFEELVQTICKQDLRPRVILDEWLNLGVVKLTRNKRVSLCSEAFIPQKGAEEKAFFLGQNISDHLYAASHNLSANPSPFFERCVYYDGLSKESVDLLQNLVKKEGMKLLLKINKQAADLKQKDIKKNVPKHRINTGMYCYHEEK